MLIDTDILIWSLRGKPRASDFLNNNKGFFISIITKLELIQGTLNKKELREMKISLKLWQAQKIPLNNEICQNAIHLSEKFFHSNSLGMADALIAATALCYHLPLATGNLKHFSPLENEGLKIFPFKID